MSTHSEVQELLSGERLTLFAQPVCDVKTGAIVFEELLLRVRQSDGSWAGPGNLLAAAERTGAITEIDEWVIARAVEMSAAGRNLSVNVSARSLSDCGFVSRIVELLSGADVDARRLTVEITETALMSDLIQAARFADGLHAKGCQFALDDFGTGYAALTYLKHLPVRYLKIDMSFIRDVRAHPRSEAMVAGIVALARGFGIETVAEGVTDSATLAFLAELGVDLAQGFFIGVPAPA